LVIRPGKELETGPLRRCIATGETHDRSSLLRFVVGPGGELVLDLACNLPGRGLWLTPRREMFERAVAKRLFSHAARRPISVSPELAGRIEAVLAQRCRDGVGLARRAGLAVAGFEKVREAARAGKVALLLAALDGAVGGREKIRALVRDLPLATVLTAAEMGAVFGRDNVVHVGLGASRLCRRLISDADKLAGFRSGAVVDRGNSPATARLVRQDGNIGLR
jgi:predicted RNA-binding protein YlxR (DUF448 family)